MLGYWIVVSTQTPEERDAIIDRKKSVLAEWETGVGGIRWLEKLIEEGKATKPCWKCSEHTSVFGFILPAGHETLEPDEEDDERDAWYRYDEPTIVHYVTDLLPAVAARIKAFSRHYRVDFSKTTQSSYWMNHCEHCGMKQGDFEMYCEPQGAFFPMDEHAASLIVLHEFVEPFGCNGSTAYGDHLFEYMRRA